MRYIESFCELLWKCLLTIASIEIILGQSEILQTIIKLHPLAYLGICTIMGIITGLSIKLPRS